MGWGLLLFLIARRKPLRGTWLAFGVVFLSTHPYFCIIRRTCSTNFDHRVIIIKYVRNSWSNIDSLDYEEGLLCLHVIDVVCLYWQDWVALSDCSYLFICTFDDEPYSWDSQGFFLQITVPQLSESTMSSKSTSPETQPRLATRSLDTINSRLASYEPLLVSILPILTWL